jgi:hypothetical protein
MNYQSPEAVEISKADEVILGAKIGRDYDEINDDFTLPVGSVIDVD